MANLNFELLKWQREVLNDPVRFKIVVAGRRCGKSRLAAVQLIIQGLQCPKGSNVMYVAPTQGQARVIIWDLLMELGHEVITASHVNNAEITLVNGAVIFVRGADRPDTLRGADLSYVVLDEYADMKPIVWEQVIRASLSRHRGGAMFIGTPKGRNHFYDLYQIGLSDDEDHKSWHFTTADNELIDPAEIAAAKKTLSTFSFKQEYLASFENAGADQFKEEWLKYGKAPPVYSTYIAIDLAGFEDVAANAKGVKKKLDQTAIAVVFVTDDGKWFVKKIEYGRWSIRETAVRILKNIRDFKPIGLGVEKGALFNAVMPYLTDLMRKNGIFAHVQPLTHGNQKKEDRVIWALQGLFEHGRVTLNEDAKWDVFVDEYLMFPTQGVHDDCFPADAPIITMEGIKPISEVTTDDYVLTRNGYRKVLKAWCKGYKSVITNFGITATPEHRVWTENRGWVSLDSLCTNDTILKANAIKETSCEKQSNSMDASTIGIQTQSKQTTGDTTQVTTSGNQHQEHCTGICGSSIMGQSQKNTTSTISTGIAATMTSPISFASHLPHIRWSIEMSKANEENLPSNSSILQASEALQKAGTHQKKDEHGIENTQKNLLQSKTCQKNPALFAEQCLSLKHKNHQCVVTSANGNDQIIYKTNEIPVYDLMVENDHEFFAYGVLVHNCIDAVSLVSQMVTTSYRTDDEEEEMEIFDVTVGF